MSKILKGKNNNTILFLVLFLFSAPFICGQNIPSNKVISSEKLSKYLNKEVKKVLGGNKISQKKLANYLRKKFSERYFYDWKNKEARFSTYKTLYPSAEKSHQENAADHLAKFNDDTPWILPFNYLNGKPVNAYALRHLARQHKMVDIAYQYHYENKNSEHLNYFKNQLKSLNTALHKNKYEKIEDGNGVFEAFRSGYRVLNWFHIHNLFLGEENYTDKDQLTTIATLLQHGAHLYKRNAKFHAGNHQTRGLSALAMIAILLRDFEGTDEWYQHSMGLLEQHLSKEINDDGFQFERTVHYHMSDIGNYYYVYQLAKISKIEVKPFWKERLKSLFISLTKIAYPNKFAPVLSDDTDDPWAEQNNISGALTLGYLLFESPKLGYFANNQVDKKMFWYITDKQLESLKNIEAIIPSMKSVHFPTTGYYIMREGWKAKDKMMIISAGLDADKPDHQHGDMLGIQATANGKIILPNYQVRYSLKDLELFKNSMTKNVALVDNELQGKEYTSNKGGSGFGKFRKLPSPTTISWNTNKYIDVYVGSHDGFENIGVTYSRKVIYIKDAFWIVKDNFSSEKTHEYKQIWQGHYSLEEGSNLIRSTFDNASGLDIYQLNKTDKVENSGQRGKQWAIVSKDGNTNFNFLTLLFPYQDYNNRIDENSPAKSFKDWKLNNSIWKTSGKNTTSLSKDNKSLFFSIEKINTHNVEISFSEKSDVFIMIQNDNISIQSLNQKTVTVVFNNEKSASLKPGETIQFK